MTIMAKRFDIKGITKKESLQLLDAYQQAIAENICHSITDNNGTIIYVNKKFCELSKYSEKELIGKTHRILKSGVHDEKVYKDLWNTIKTGKLWHGEIKNKTKDGTFYWSDTTILPIFDKNNNIIQYLALRIPITEKKELEEKQKVYTKSIEEMLFMTSHKVRQPIAHILGTTQLLDQYMNSPDKLKKLVGYMTQSAVSLDTFTRELTTFIYGLQVKGKNPNRA